MPLVATASATDLMRSSLTLQANLFQLFQPIGGVGASVLRSIWALAKADNRKKKRAEVAIRRMSGLSWAMRGHCIGSAQGNRWVSAPGESPDLFENFIAKFEKGSRRPRR